MNSALPNKQAPSPDELAAHLRAAVGALVRSTRTVDRLAPIPAAVLDLLDVRGPMTTADLAASRGVRHQTMAATVKELTDAGFLAVGADPDDARKKILTLTTAGKSAIDADRRQRVSALAEALDAALDEDDRRVMAHALHLIDRVTATVAEARPSPTGGNEPLTGAW
ncbi:MarR family winged helix-turn-helix transcriptional regulator [Streptomyces sp. RPT161]|uniref:MarR family winged helix-turn-helix transcriptional regulator n=1 Tax=Streptomyces sp. RPT161 TaxID=3015993 RepID=UPI0022B8DF1C|nr:MarR family transcriptional regulator [Streptomyces sp. RPT161]